MKKFFLILFLIFLSNSVFSEPTGDKFTLKLLKRTGENLFSNLAYECNECTFKQFESLKPPRGWSKSPKQIIIPEGKLENHLTLDGIPSSLNFISEIPGDEFKLIAKSIEGKIVKLGFNGIMVKTKVMRQQYRLCARTLDLAAQDLREAWCWRSVPYPLRPLTFGAHGPGYTVDVPVPEG